MSVCFSFDQTHNTVYLNCCAFDPLTVGAAWLFN